jgi:hypothetical protein
MGGTNAIGVLTWDGSVKYYLVSDGGLSPHEVLRDAIITHIQRCDFECDSVDDYFSEERFTEDDSSIRYLMIEDNLMRYRYWSKEEYTLSVRKLK